MVRIILINILILIIFLIIYYYLLNILGGKYLTLKKDKLASMILVLIF